MDALSQFKEEVLWTVASALDAMGVKVQFELETPDQEKADLAIPCFPMAKALRRNPVEIANDIASRLQPMPTIAKAWADRGYLNFKVNEDYLATNTVREILSDTSVRMAEESPRVIGFCSSIRRSTPPGHCMSAGPATRSSATRWPVACERAVTT